MGGFFRLNLVSIFPGCIYFKLSKGEKPNYWFYLFAVISTIVSYTCAIVS